MSFQFFGTINHWSWSRYKKGEFVEDESYEWRDAVLERRLGVRIRETKYFIFFREIRYKQRTHNYWIEKAGCWRVKIPFCNTYEQTRIGNWILVDLPFMIFCLWIVSSNFWSLNMVTKWFLKPIKRGAESHTKTERGKQGVLCVAIYLLTRNLSRQQWLFLCFDSSCLIWESASSIDSCTSSIKGLLLQLKWPWLE